MSEQIFTQLDEPSENANLNKLPDGFDADIAYLLGQCCSATYTQYAQYPTPLGTRGTFNGVTANEWSYTIKAELTTVEALGLGATVGKSGYYRKVPIGFAMHCVSAKFPKGINVIAIRGTSTYDEWKQDASVYPTQFLVGTNAGPGYEGGVIGYDTPAGSAHGGFLNVYTQGTNGALPERSIIKKGWVHNMYGYSRVDGSISKQVHTMLENDVLDSSIPLYVTGHSLGAGLAVICATDIALNFPSKYDLHMYNLAGPRVAAGLIVDGHTVFGPASTMVDYFDRHIPKSYRIVNEPDIIPISIPPSTKVGPGEIQFAHVAPSRQVSFCKQAGSIGGNHSCDNTYVPYLKYLAEHQNASAEVKVKAKPKSKPKTRRTRKKKTS